MGSQVAVAEVAVVPTFKGFRKRVSNETDSSAKAASTGFVRVFSKAGTDSGKQVGSGFKNAFEQTSKGTSDRLTKSIEANVAKASRALSTARLKEQDSVGKVRLAETQLAEARKKYASDSSQVVRAEERLATASRQLTQAHEGTEHATDDLKQAQGELARAADRAGDELEDSGKRGVSGFKSNVLGGVKSFAGPLIAAFAAIGIGRIVADAFTTAKNFVLDTITMASDLEQSAGGVNAVFKDQAILIQIWAEQAADAVGLSESAYNEFATVVGAQMKNLGLPIGEIASLTDGLIQTGADLAAQYGGTTSDAVSALSSLLRGERDPIERYGVSMNEAAVKAEALSLGLVTVTKDAAKVEAAQLRAEVAQRKYNEAVKKHGKDSSQALSANAALISANSSLETALDGTTGELTAQQKAQATLSLLTKQTADATGAFARESDTLAGKQQRNAAAWDNIQTSLGEKLLPVMSELASIIGEDVIPVIADMVEKHGPELAKSFEDILPSLVELAQELLPELPGLVKSFTDSLPAFVTFLQLATPLLITFMEANNGWTTILYGLFDLISGDTSLEEFATDMLALEGPFGDVIRWGTDLMQGFIDWFTAIPREVQNGIDDAVAFITGLPERVENAIGDLGELLVSSGKDLIDGFISGMKKSPIGEAVSGIVDWVTGYFPHSPAKRGPLSGSGWSNLKKSGATFWDQWVDGMGGTEPQFPDLPRFPPAGGAAVSVASPTGTGSSGVTQINNIAHMPPQEAVEMAGQRLTSLARRARV